MKKPLAYIAAAVVLGFAIMMLPLATQPEAPTYLSPLNPLSPHLMNAPSESGIKGEDSSALRFYGIAGQPANLLPSTLVFLSGLIVALTAYVTIKKRMP